MKRLSYLFASSMLLSLSLNSFAGTGDLPKASTKEEAIEIAAPNDDPSPPPNTTFTYYLITVKASHPLMTQDEINAEPTGYYINNTVSTTTISKPATGIPANGSLLTASATCREDILNTAMCGTCRTWGTFFNAGITATSTISAFTMFCPTGGL